MKEHFDSMLSLSLSLSFLGILFSFKRNAQRNFNALIPQRSTLRSNPESEKKIDALKTTSKATLTFEI